MRDDQGRIRPPGLWRTVSILLGAARKRAAGREKRQRELFSQRARKPSGFLSGNSGFILGVLLMALINLGAAFFASNAVECGEEIEAEQGKIVVEKWFLDEVTNILGWNALGEHKWDPRLEYDYKLEAHNLSPQGPSREGAIESELRRSVQAGGVRDLVVADSAVPGFADFPKAGRYPAMLGSIVLILWGIMLVLQGEGLDLDVQRRRHPMWEWLFSHPVSPWALFLAEMLSPVVANPAYWGAPVFVGFVYGFVYGPWVGLWSGVFLGVPLSLTAACVGKALEVGIFLRCSPRTRGAVVGLVSWLGYASMLLLVVGALTDQKIISAIGQCLKPLALVPWPWLGLFLGKTPHGTFSFPLGWLACWIAAIAATAGAIGFSVWGAQQGLAGKVGQADSLRPKSQTRTVHFGREPLYRKEFLWFIRDRSAIVQTILIPLTVASYQLFNLRGMIGTAHRSWSLLCGAAILFGTYFLWILGPKSLSSEGSALWIASTWPRGLESLLKAKAWLWSVISCGVVSLVLVYAVIRYLDSYWKVALVGLGWWFFARSMAEKAVTLVAVPSSSGEPEKIPMGRRWAAQLGMFTFSIGVCTQQWQIAIMGIVYSSLTAAAMWQNFRARLPYLFDVWSETLPRPPTLMHAMIAISILVEGGAILTGLAMIVVRGDNIAPVRLVIYGVCAIIVSLGVHNFLARRGVPSREVWCWPQSPTRPGSNKPWWCGDGSRGRSLVVSLLGGLVGGLVIGLMGLGYLAILRHVPYTAELLKKSAEQMAKIPGLRKSYMIYAIGFAPFAEEYLFRGLLFRALDREWGGWRAVLGSAAFFAIFHPPLSWLPVGLLGATNALVFKNTGRLAPAVVLHLVYNIVVLS